MNHDAQLTIVNSLFTDAGPHAPVLPVGVPLRGDCLHAEWALSVAMGGMHCLACGLVAPAVCPGKCQRPTTWLIRGSTLVCYACHKVVVEQGA